MENSRITCSCPMKRISELSNSNVYIKNISHVTKIINDFVLGSCSKLQIVSDFDRTITKQHENGKIYLSSFAMFGKCQSVPEYYRETYNALDAKYVPIENDPTMPALEKTKHMEEWWLLTEKALKGLKVSSEEIDRVCIELGPSIRDRSKEFFDELFEAEIPVLVFSSGLGDIVLAVLKHCDVLLPNVEVISNFLKYDNDGTIMGFKDSIIHVYNKNKYAIKGTDFYNRISDRDNVILLGDSLGDANMTQGMDHLTSVLKIGFLYHRSEEFLPSYMNTFDIVLLDDQTMDIPRAILNYIRTSAVQQPE